MAQNDSDQIFREVEEELRRERYEQLWKQYNGLIVGTALAVVAGVGGWQFYQWNKKRTAEDAGQRFQSALDLLDEKKGEEARKALDGLSKSGPSGYRTLASMRLAAAQAEAGDKDAAVKSFEAVAADGAADPMLRDLARLRAAMLRSDKADWTEMQNRLNDLKKPDGVWRHSARELLGLSAWKAGKRTEAEAEFQGLLEDQATPPALRHRAETMLTLLLEGGKPGAQAPAEKGKAPAK
jgi:hypothetical protein